MGDTQEQVASVSYGPYLNSSKNQRFHQGCAGIIGVIDYFFHSVRC